MPLDISNATSTTGLGLELLQRHRYRWLLTGVAGFIGSNILEALLSARQEVVGVDNFVTGKKSNLDDVKESVGPEAWAGFHFIQDDLINPEVCQEACKKVDFVLHQAALGSVPRSIENPARTNQHNVTMSLNLLVAAREAGVKRLIYASSSSVYGDNPDLPKVEDRIGNPLSPYAVSKRSGELYAHVFHKVYGLPTLGLRYFNAFGPRQRSDGPYAAVIPRWFNSLAEGRPVDIYGDGTTSRDFCFVYNLVQANVKAALCSRDESFGRVFNVALGATTSLNHLYEMIRAIVGKRFPEVLHLTANHGAWREGDIRHSLADIGAAKEAFDYAPVYEIQRGLQIAAPWYLQTAQGKN